ncbi:MAG: hypothetical protein AB9880_07675 [Christensenellales bacterium]
MKKAVGALLLSLIILAAGVLQPALAQGADLTGDWVCVAVDLGDGVKSTEYMGSSVGDLMKLSIKADGTLLLTSMGAPIPGTWQANQEGLAATIDGEPVAFLLQEGQLLNQSEGVTIYLGRAAAKAEPGGLLGLLKGSRYLGRWTVAAIDEGDGVLKKEYQGLQVAQMMSIQINRDGSFVMTSLGMDTPGQWQEITGGIRLLVEDEPVDLTLKDDQLVGKDDELTIYLERAQESGQTAATAAPALSTFAGTWRAVSYTAMGFNMDIKTLFPDGCVMTLREDGTGEAFVTKDYTDRLTWSEAGGTLAISGGFVFSSPVWDSQKGELTLAYSSSSVLVVFKKDQAATAPTEAPTAEPTQAPTEAPTQVPTAAPTLAPVPLGGTALFSLDVSGPGWSENTGWRTDREDYCAVRHELKDAAGTVTASIAITASSEGVRNYRDKLKTLQGYAVAAGKAALDQLSIGGIAFQGFAYEKWGWQYQEYAARVPASRVTLTITVEQPGAIGAGLQNILDSLVFKLPTLSPPNVDPPLPEDGTPYQPVPGSATLGTATVNAAWLKSTSPILVDSIFNNQIALSNGRLCILSGSRLSAWRMAEGILVPDETFAGGSMTLPDTFEYLATGQDGILYASNGIFNILAIKDGSILEDNGLSGYLVMHPSGTWGLSFWVNADPMLVRAEGGKLKEEPWILANLSDPATRKGRFSAISCVAITDTRIYVAGTDALKGESQRVAVYDLEGQELLTLGAEDWTADDAFGSVTGLVETPAGLLVQDGNYRAFKLFSPQGLFLGEVESDKLLGTDYPWLSSMIPGPEGVLVAAAQSRQDESGDELLIFNLSGFGK